jgi:hypothetical protein
MLFTRRNTFKRDLRPERRRHGKTIQFLDLTRLDKSGSLWLGEIKREQPT